ncbi:MAG TPA: hypothetical protein VMT10_00525 [Solirubrobacteraceae bacterium]|nr:hypothetical protein [Solirubrobacteraceae bacterium]
MPRFPGILDRFRRVLAPPGGPAQALGVPASGADLEAELGPLLADLEAVDARAAQIEDEARREARERRERAARESAAMLEQARARADRERIRAAEEQRGRGRRSSAAVREEARREARRIGARSGEAIDELVEEVLACVRRAGR